MSTESPPSVNYTRIILWMVLAVLFYFSVEYAIGLLTALVEFIPLPDVAKVIFISGVKVLQIAVLAVVPFLLLAQAKKKDMSGGEGMPFPKGLFVSLLIATPFLKFLDWALKRVALWYANIPELYAHWYFGYTDYQFNSVYGYEYHSGFSFLMGAFPWLKMLALVVVGIIIFSKFTQESHKARPTSHSD